MVERSDPKDRLFRLFALLRLIPREPGRISTPELYDKLKAQGFDMTRRTLQRDLNVKLSAEFPLLSHEEGNTNYWSFSKHAPHWDFPSPDLPVALAFLLAESHLEKLLPQGLLQLLEPYFEQARAQLEIQQHMPPARWAKRVRALPNGKTLLPAKVDSAIWTTVSTALLKGHSLRVTYLSRSKQQPSEMTLHPAGLVARHSQSYLLARVEGYNDVRQFALHRIQQATALEAPAEIPDDFDIDHYLQGSLNNPAPAEMVELVADVSPQIAWLLRETPLSTEQSLEPLEGTDWHRLRAMVPDDKETLWWVFGLGENVRVWEPNVWVKIIKEKIAKLEKLYV
ncbi:helix-turn-helix transcriptional regulator [Halopseudomonas xiamenensis]|uniref:helix-turn-helix transcriptional regulator n=1 Tax=Halopseudomonas xiamenensis TaxID=157792 RepID=UPI002E2E22E6|nr:WYL domain-containing protein [Halopseudomonas xiamenensis]